MKEKKQKKAGFGARLAFAIILTVFAVLSAFLGSGTSGGGVIRQLFILMAIFFITVTVLQYIAAFAGKKHRWANTISIVIGSVCTIMCGLGVLAIVGGVQGKRAVCRDKRQEEALKAEAADGEAQQFEQSARLALEKGEDEVAAVTAEPTTPAAIETVGEEAEAVPEYIQPKMGIKGKKAIMIVLTVSYSLLLLMGILLASVPAMGKMLSGMGICEEISARAYGITIGVMWVALVPSFGYYFATVAPVEPSKKVKIVIAAVCAVISVAMVVVFFVVINAVKIDGIAAVKEFYEGSDSWFIPLSMVFATLALMICHALTLFRINPAKIKNAKPEKCDDGFINAMKHVLALLIYGVLGLVKGILTFKEKQPDIFILVSTILLTWLAHFVSFVFAIICIAILITVVIMMFAGLVKISYDTTGSSNAEAVAGRDRYGNETNLTEQPYVIDDRSQKVYKDDYGNEYVSDDGGKTVREYHRYDDE